MKLGSVEEILEKVSLHFPSLYNYEEAKKAVRNTNLKFPLCSDTKKIEKNVNFLSDNISDNTIYN